MVRCAEPLTRIALTVEEAAAVLGLDKARVGGLVRAGVLPHVRVGQRVLVGRAALEQWLTEQCLGNAGHELPREVVRGQLKPVALGDRPRVRAVSRRT